MSTLRIWTPRHLPHWERTGAAYFLTFRLHGSIPLSVIDQYRRDLDSNLPLLRQAALLRRNVESYLDRASHALLLDPKLAAIVANVILFGNGEQYTLIAWAVMPNHVHVLFRPTSTPLEKIIQRWKSISAREINQVLERTAPVWQAEYFDRIIRNEKMMANIRRYIHQNPARAGLINWPFVG